LTGRNGAIGYRLNNSLYCKKAGNAFRNLGLIELVHAAGRLNSPHASDQSLYNVRKAKPKGWGREYQQHHRYKQLHDMSLTPYHLFCNDLIWQMQVWHQQGNRLSMMMDVNEHVITEEFC